MTEIPLFPLGALAVTRSAADTLQAGDVAEALTRHALGDWGDVPPDDAADNDRSVIVGDRLFSAYRSRKGEPFFVVTEFDRSVTTVMLPSDY